MKELQAPKLLLLWEKLTTDLMNDSRRFSASFRHNLTQYINQNLLDGLCLLATIPYAASSSKQTKLKELDALLVRLRVLVRQCFLQAAMAERRYEFHQGRINELGKMLGGWLKYLSDRH